MLLLPSVLWAEQNKWAEHERELTRGIREEGGCAGGKEPSDLWGGASGYRDTILEFSTAAQG